MRITFAGPDEAAEVTGTAVVVDVLRAFTTAAYALARGATQVRLVATVEEALAWRDGHPGALAMGEVDGHPVPAFDLGNSPLGLVGSSVAGRPLVQRTTAGTQGVLRTRRAARRYAGSFVVARATAEHIRRGTSDDVTFVITGAHSGRDGDEDLACAELIAARLCGEDPDPLPFLDRVARSTAGRMFTDGAHPHLDPGDLVAACAVDALGLALVVGAGDVLRAEPIV